LTGPVIEEGINFNYPTLDQIGQVQSTVFTFDKTNSNLGDLFNEKAASITYDVDAITKA